MKGLEFNFLEKLMLIEEIRVEVIIGVLWFCEFRLFSIGRWGRF